MALLTLDQLRADMGRSSRDFSEDEEGEAQFVIDIITGYILSRCGGLAFDSVEDYIWRAQADYAGIIDMPFFPIDSVSSVKSVRTGLETYWDWDYFGSIFDLDPFETVAITLTYGWTDVPDDLVLVARSLAKRHMINPTGIRQQTVGAISETYASIADGLNDLEESILAQYERGNSSLRLGTSAARRIRNLPTL